MILDVSRLSGNVILFLLMGTAVTSLMQPCDVQKSPNIYSIRIQDLSQDFLYIAKCATLHYYSFPQLKGQNTTLEIAHARLEHNGTAFPMGHILDLNQACWKTRPGFMDAISRLPPPGGTGCSDAFRLVFITARHLSLRLLEKFGNTSFTQLRVDITLQADYETWVGEHFASFQGLVLSQLRDVYQRSCFLVEDLSIERGSIRMSFHLKHKEGIRHTTGITHKANLKVPKNIDFTSSAKALNARRFPFIFSHDFRTKRRERHELDLQESDINEINLRQTFSTGHSKICDKEETHTIFYPNFFRVAESTKQKSPPLDVPKYPNDIVHILTFKYAHKTVKNIPVKRTDIANSLSPHSYAGNEIETPGPRDWRSRTRLRTRNSRTFHSKYPDTGHSVALPSSRRQEMNAKPTKSFQSRMPLQAENTEREKSWPQFEVGLIEKSSRRKRRSVGTASNDSGMRLKVRFKFERAITSTGDVEEFKKHLIRQLAKEMRVPVSSIEDLMISSGTDVSFTLTSVNDANNIMDDDSIHEAADTLKMKVGAKQLRLTDLKGEPLLTTSASYLTLKDNTSDFTIVILILIGIVMIFMIVLMLTVAYLARRIVEKRQSSSRRKKAYRNFDFGRESSQSVGKYSYDSGLWLGPGPEPMFEAPEAPCYRPPTVEQIASTPRPITAVRTRLKQNWNVDERALSTIPDDYRQYAD